MVTWPPCSTLRRVLRTPRQPPCHRAQPPTAPDLAQVHADDEMLTRLSRSHYTGTDALSRRFAALRDRVRGQSAEDGQPAPSTIVICVLLLLTLTCFACATVVLVNSRRLGVFMLAVTVMPLIAAGVISRWARLKG